MPRKANLKTAKTTNGQPATKEAGEVSSTTEVANAAVAEVAEVPAKRAKRAPTPVSKRPARTETPVNNGDAEVDSAAPSKNPRRAKKPAIIEEDDENEEAPPAAKKSGRAKKATKDNADKKEAVVGEKATKGRAKKAVAAPAAEGDAEDAAEEQNGTESVAKDTKKAAPKGGGKKTAAAALEEPEEQTQEAEGKVKETKAKGKEPKAKAKAADTKTKAADTKSKAADAKAKETETTATEPEADAKEPEAKTKVSKAKAKAADSKAKEPEDKKVENAVKAKESAAKAKEPAASAKDAETKKTNKRPAAADKEIDTGAAGDEADKDSENVDEKPEKAKRGKKASSSSKATAAKTTQKKKENGVAVEEISASVAVATVTSLLKTEAEATAKTEAKAEEASGSTKKPRGRKRAAAEPSVKDVVKNGESGDLEDEEVAPKPTKAKRGGASKKAPVDKESSEVGGSGLLNSVTTDYNESDFDLVLPNGSADSEEPRFNLKISSWNVAGLRSWLKKDGLKFLDYEHPDIFCIQETKCTTDQLPDEARIPGYHPYWLCMPGGYAGVAIYSKKMPIHVEYGIGNKEFDDNGRIITAEYEKFYLINVYVPNSGRGLVNLEPRMRWEKLFQEYTTKLDKLKPLIICGDMNVSHHEIDLANPKTNTKSAGFTKEEREKMTELLGQGYIDTFRHLYPDRKGAYTYWTYMANARARNVGWRLDYFIVSERFMNRVVDNCIRAQVKGSDHCPITLFLKL